MFHPESTWFGSLSEDTSLGVTPCGVECWPGGCTMWIEPMAVMWCSLHQETKGRRSVPSYLHFQRLTCNHFALCSYNSPICWKEDPVPREGWAHHKGTGGFQGAWSCHCHLITLDLYTSGAEGKMGLWWQRGVINPDCHEEKGLLVLSGAERKAFGAQIP